jgi:uncharacterized membrane protein YozB (DUF420 family)
MALLDLGAVVVLALLGVRQIRHGHWRAHRNFMLAATALVVGFLGAYLLKLHWMGHEDVASWSPFQVGVLRVHEVGIAAMLLGGAFAGYRAWRFRWGLPPGDRLLPLAERPPERTSHLWAGRVAVAGAALAWLTAALLLAGMFWA